ncbi:T9SS type A sorting domain-containing protein [Hymenobacter ruricola]|uniref:T9SS type A sorting domain-containing protein n=1 Tax=Hymenobacter ruricola TaxID=2791023 RepID=A0ABS0I0H4_9BACT|nr:T9SS type A sorting domain-containing protein [Hymenobacter ruricola]MBF9220228.1 T9SS type A sorting domain-containing protein [Hymenobacter ruricola]
MSKFRRFCQCLTVVGGWCLVLAGAALAQPTLIGERKNTPRFQALFSKSFELPGHRFVHCGEADVTIQSRGKKELALVVSKASGDTVRYRRLNLNQADGGDFFVDVVLGPDHLLTYLSNHHEPNASPTLPPERFYALTQVDTLGNVRWQRRYPVADVASVGALLRVPDGFLVLVNGVSPASTPAATYGQGGAAKFDLLGNLLWRRTWPSRGYGGVGLLNGLVARPDGSYLATGYSDNGTPYTGGAALPRFDHWLVQFSPQGDTLRTARFGAGAQFDGGFFVSNTRGGGALVSGARRLPTSANNDAQLVQVDSLLRPQWTYTQPNTSNQNDYFGFAYGTPRGDVVFGGGRVNALTRQVGVEFTAFTAGGAPRWAFQYRFGNDPQRPTGLAALVGSADSSAYVVGGTRATNRATVYEDYFARFANVGSPYVAELCRVRPQAQVGYAFTAGGDSLRLVSLSTPGPRHAELALWHWDFGDGTFFDGPAPPPHRYAGAPGAGTAVRLTVTNNLGCTSTQAVFPFALATAAARALAAGARLWPNPTAGRATLEVPGLRAQGPVRVEVLNTLGQVVQARAVAVRQGVTRAELDLGGLPPGVYAVRLHAQEGTVVKRLVKD